MRIMDSAWREACELVRMNRKSGEKFLIFTEAIKFRMIRNSFTIPLCLDALQSTHSRNRPAYNNVCCTRNTFMLY